MFQTTHNEYGTNDTFILKIMNNTFFNNDFNNKFHLYVLIMTC